jgi:hypothetical protein
MTRMEEDNAGLSLSRFRLCVNLEDSPGDGRHDPGDDRVTRCPQFVPVHTSHQSLGYPINCSTQSPFKTQDTWGFPFVLLLSAPSGPGRCRNCGDFPGVFSPRFFSSFAPGLGQFHICPPGRSRSCAPLRPSFFRPPAFPSVAFGVGQC